MAAKRSVQKTTTQEKENSIEIAPCISCGAKGMTTIKYSSSGKWDYYSSTNCTKCGCCKGSLVPRGGSRTVSQGEWSRNAQSEKEAFAKDVLQPIKKDGTINKHFVQAHGTASLEKELKTTKQAILKEVEKYG